MHRTGETRTARTRHGRRLRAVAVTAAVLSGVLGGASCSGTSDGTGDGTESTPSQSPTPVLSAPAASVTPSPSISIPASLSAEESAAVKKAIQAYVQWVSAIDSAVQSGGTDLQLLEAITVQSALIAGQQEAAIYLKDGLHSEGDRIIERIGVTSVSLRTDPAKRVVPEVILASCVNSSHIDVLDQSGASVVTDWRRVFEYTTWVRYYPQSVYPTVGPGVDGWLVGQYQNTEVESC